jgi:hypothetical protein
LSGSHKYAMNVCDHCTGNSFVMVLKSKTEVPTLIEWIATVIQRQTVTARVRTCRQKWRGGRRARWRPA